MKSEINRILIIGIGGVGLHLARRLDHEGYEVTVLEANAELLKHIVETSEFSVVHGNAMDLSSWEEAGASGMDLLITATNDDAVNMLACVVAERLGIQRRIARLRTMDFDNLNSEESRSFHIDLVVHPEELIAQEIQRLVRRSSGNDMVDVGNGNMRVLGLRVTEDSPLVGMTPRELSKRYTETYFRVVALARGITTIIPQADESIFAADQVFIMALTQNMDRLMQEIGVEQGRVRRMAILGGGLIGQRAAQLLEDEVEVRLIERDAARAEELAGLMKRAEVMHSDGTNLDDLIQCGIPDLDSFVATTGDNETNIISCLLAKHLMNRENREVGGRAGKTIALVDNEDYLVLSSTIGLDIALNAKISTANEILKFVRRNELVSVAHLHGVDAEVVEFQAAPNSPITKKTLGGQASFFREYGILIGGVEHEGRWEVAVGTTRVLPESRVIAICSSRQLRNVHRLFSM